MESLDELIKSAKGGLERIENLKDLERFELEFFGRKQGKLTAILRSLSGLAEEKRKVLGAQANQFRQELEASLEKKRTALKKVHLERDLKRQRIDITRPGVRVSRGHIHPLTHIRLEAEKIFSSLGFGVVEGPDVETEYYNFDALNIPRDHPSRDLWDTFWLRRPKGVGAPTKTSELQSKYLLRTHTSPVQIRYMESHNPPFRIIVPGKVFRHEATDASHDFEFWQLEGLMVGKDISVANLKYILNIFFQKLFGRDMTIRLRPSYFPFVEPGFEFDITCVACRGKGCAVCKQSGWLELGGAGMVHQKVFEAAGYVSGEFQGFAFGMGLDRLAMMKYKITDIRLFRGGDIRFLKQF
ncbi:MAG: phenylalanine--tRNA ligase subunit alpha [Patescibacteria group bacterium]